MFLEQITKNIDYLALRFNHYRKIEDLSEIAILLIQNGANVNATYIYGNTPLHLDYSSSFYLI